MTVFAYMHIRYLDNHFHDFTVYVCVDKVINPKY